MEKHTKTFRENFPAGKQKSTIRGKKGTLKSSGFSVLCTENWLKNKHESFHGKAGADCLSKLYTEIFHGSRLAGHHAVPRLGYLHGGLGPHSRGGSGTRVI